MSGHDRSINDVLRRGLTEDLPPVEKGAESLLHRLNIFKTVYDEWTGNLSKEEAYADKYFDGTLSAIDDHLRLHGENAQIPKVIDRVQAHDLTYDRFVNDFLIPNKPVIIEGIDKNFAPLQNWLLNDGSLNVNYLRSKYGDSKIIAVEVQDCKDGHQFSERHEMTLKNYLDYWDGSNEFVNHSDKNLYLKDWHFVHNFPQDKIYDCPTYFKDDWLNMFYERNNLKNNSCFLADSNFKFVYLGKKGSWTPVHTDVYKSYSWSVNIFGKKLWRLLPPQNSPLLKDRFNSNVSPCFECYEFKEMYPNLEAAFKSSVLVEQGVNEAIFVPSGWYHSVQNVEDTLSINHNWFNAFNIHWIIDHLHEEFQSASTAIEDLRSIESKEIFDGLVHRNMALNCGLSFFAMSVLLGWTAANLLKSLDNNNDMVTYNLFSLHRCCLALNQVLEAILEDSSDAYDNAVEDDVDNCLAFILSMETDKTITALQKLLKHAKYTINKYSSI